MKQADFDGIVKRHAHVESAISPSDKTVRASDMAYLSHLDRAELLAEVARLNEALKDLASRGNAYVSRTNQ